MDNLMKKIKEAYDKFKYVEEELKKSKQENKETDKKYKCVEDELNKLKQDNSILISTLLANDTDIKYLNDIVFTSNIYDEKQKKQIKEAYDKFKYVEEELKKSKQENKETDKKYKCIENELNELKEENDSLLTAQAVSMFGQEQSIKHFKNEDNLIKQINRLHDEIINIKAEKLDMYYSNQIMAEKITQLEANFNKVMMENDKLRSGEGVPNEMKKSMILTSQLKDIFNEYKGNLKVNNEENYKNRIIELETKIKKDKIYSKELIKENNTLIYSITRFKEKSRLLVEENDWYKMKLSPIGSELPDEDKSVISFGHFDHEKCSKKCDFVDIKKYYILGKFKNGLGEIMNNFDFNVGLYSVTDGVENLMKKYLINFVINPKYSKSGYHRSAEKIMLHDGKYVLRSLNNIVFKKKVYFKFEVTFGVD